MTIFKIIFIISLINLIYFILKYVKALELLLLVDGANSEIKKFTMNGQNVTSKLALLQDMKFFFIVITRKYQKSVTSAAMIEAFDRCRKYLIIQYFFGLVMFSIPIIVNVLGLK